MTTTTDAKIVSDDYNAPDPDGATPAAPKPKPKTSDEKAEAVMLRVKHTAAQAGDVGAAELNEYRLNFRALFDVIDSLQGANNSLAERSAIDRADLEKARQTAAAFQSVHEGILKDYRVKVSDLGRKVDRYKMRCVGLTMAIKAGWSLKIPSEW